MRRAAIYARVSSDKQEEQKTIESQVAALREACSRAGDKVVQEYLDDGVSGATLARPGLDGLRDDATKSLFDCVYILSPDRLARRYVYQAVVIEELRKQRIDIIFLDKQVTDRPEDQLLLGIQGLISEYERAQILERTRRGRLFRARRGEIMGGLPPYGYRYVKKTTDKSAHYLIDEEQAAVVRVIFDLYLKRQSIGRVVVELDRLGVKPPEGGRFWTRSVIYRLLKRESYVGVSHYNKDQYVSGTRNRRAREDWIPIEVPAIVGPQVFQATQDLLVLHKPNRKTRTYLLSGLVRCAFCGSRYTGSATRRGRDAYYKCGNDEKEFPRPRKCAARMVRADKLEPAVISVLESAITNPEFLANRVLELFERLRQRGHQQTEQEGNGKALASLENQEQRLLDIYVEGGISKEEYLKRRRLVQARKALLTEPVGDIPPIVQDIDRARVLEGLEHFCRLAREQLQGLSPERQRAFLAHVVKRVVYDWKTRAVTVVVVVPQEEQPGKELVRVGGGGKPVTRSNALTLELVTHIA